MNSKKHLLLNDSNHMNSFKLQEFHKIIIFFTQPNIYTSSALRTGADKGRVSLEVTTC